MASSYTFAQLKLNNGNEGKGTHTWLENKMPATESRESMSHTQEHCG